MLAAESLGERKTISQITTIFSVLVLMSHRQWGAFGEVFGFVVAGKPWVAWFAAGALYASGHGDIRTYLNNLPQDTKLAFYAWLLVSTSLLYYAVLFLFRGLLKGSPRPPA